MLGEVYVNEPESNNVPLVDAEYQSTVSPDAGVAPTVTVPVPQREAATAAGAAGTAFILATIGLLVADTHPVEVVLDST